MMMEKHVLRDKMMITRKKVFYDLQIFSYLKARKIITHNSCDDNNLDYLIYFMFSGVIRRLKLLSFFLSPTGILIVIA